MENEFKVGDIIVQIGHPQRWRVLEVQLKSMTYRVKIVNDIDSCITSFNMSLADRNFVKVGRWNFCSMVEEDEVEDEI